MIQRSNGIEESAGEEASGRIRNCSDVLSRKVDKLTKRLFGNFQGSHLLVSAFVLLALLVIVVTSWLLVAAGNRGIHGVLEEVSYRVREAVAQETDRFLRTPDVLNGLILSAIKAARVSIDAPRSMRSLFWDAPRFDGTTVSGMYYAASNGDFYGIDAVSPKWPAREWRYTQSSGITGGLMNMYSTDDVGRIVGPPEKFGAYDPRTRPWFIAADESGNKPVWTDVYNNFDNGKATITRAQGLRSPDGSLVGVAGVDLFLDHLHAFLASLDVGRSGTVFLTDGKGTLLGAYASTEPDIGIEVLGPANQAKQRFVRESMRWIEANEGGIGAIASDFSRHLTIDGTDGYLSVISVDGGSGLDWRIVVFLPKQAFYAGIHSLWVPVLGAAIPAFLLALLAFLTFVSLIVRPLVSLKEASRRIALGEFDTRIDTSCNNEVGDLATAIDEMRGRLNVNFAELEKQKRLAETTLEAITDGVINISQAGTIQYMNSVAERLTGTNLSVARGQPIARVVRAQDELSGAPLTRTLILRSMADAHAFGQAVTLTDAEGTAHLVQCHVTPVTGDDGEGHGAVINFTDLTEELRLKNELVYRATHDELTGMLNRAEFERQLGRAVDSAKQRRYQHVLVCVDVDQFKIVNDRIDHSAGDELLRQIAGLVVNGVRPGDIVARIGGDEFVLLMEQCTVQEASGIVDAMRARIRSHRFVIGEYSSAVSVSSGLVGLSDRSEGVDAVLRDAVNACFIAKQSGRDRMHVHRDDDDRMTRLRSDREWVDRIESAIRQERFQLVGQVIEAADASAKSHRHVELLLRMIDTDGSMVSPADFLPAAERYDKASRIDRWVVRRALDWMASIAEEAERPEICAINLSGQSLGDESFLPFMVEAIRKSGVQPERLCFEITETAAIENLSSALSLIETLRGSGCAFALDDFGSGLSSFAYLKSLPVDYLKIDGLFVRDMLDDPLDLAMVRSINEVGQTMGMRTIAEYVESTELRNALCAIGVDFVQGFGVCKPLALEMLRFPDSDNPLTRASGT